jgi:stalled ribosome rescue protein Dom34
MTKFHAVVWTDHHNAQVLQFDADQVQAQKLKSHDHHTRQHGSSVRSEHEYFASLCDALAGITEVLLTGPHTALADFKHYVAKHRPALAPHIVGWEPVDHPTDGQLLALARQFFTKFDRMAGTPTPT